MKIRLLGVELFHVDIKCLKSWVEPTILNIITL